jgi:predicted P-loop ATPase
MSKLNKKKEIKSQIPQISIVEDYLIARYDIRYNVVSNEIEIKSKNENNYNVLNENNLYRELHLNNIKFPMNNLMFLLRSDFVEKYNPFYNYFENLPEWDKQIDHIEILANHVIAKNQIRFNHHFKKMLVRTIACALLDGVFNKQAFILVHEKQNSGKSTFCRWLCPDILKNYIAENISTDKDSHIALCENLLINMDELSTLGKSEINTLKSLFSKDTIKVRRPFEKKAISVARRASFIGSTNNSEFLNDETGSVRWLCFEIDEINWQYKKDININKVYSQAYFLFKNNFKYDLTHDEIEENERENEKHQIITAEMELIREYFAPGTKEDHDAFLPARKVIDELNLKGVNVNKLNFYVVGKSLKKLKFNRDQKFNGIFQEKGYYIKRIK